LKEPINSRMVASLDRKCLGQKMLRELEALIRGIFDKETLAYPVVSGNHYMLGLTLCRRFREVSGAAYVVVRGR
jgi:hypothetical protein